MQRPQEVDRVPQYDDQPHVRPFIVDAAERDRRMQIQDGGFADGLMFVGGRGVEAVVGVACGRFPMRAQIIREEVRLLRVRQEDARVGLQIFVERRGAALGSARDDEIGSTHGPSPPYGRIDGALGSHPASLYRAPRFVVPAGWGTADCDTSKRMGPINRRM